MQAINFIRRFSSKRAVYYVLLDYMWKQFFHFTQKICVKHKWTNRELIIE